MAFRVCAQAEGWHPAELRAGRWWRRSRDHASELKICNEWERLDDELLDSELLVAVVDCERRWVAAHHLTSAHVTAQIYAGIMPQPPDLAR